MDLRLHFGILKMLRCLTFARQEGRHSIVQPYAAQLVSVLKVFLISTWIYSENDVDL